MQTSSPTPQARWGKNNQNCFLHPFCDQNQQLQTAAMMAFWKQKHWISFLFLGIALILYCYKYPSSSQTSEELPNSIYDFTVKDIYGADVSLSNYKGKVILLVNVASKCGLTDSNYKELNILYEKYKTQGLEILAFPCNQFGWQEPGSNEEIKETACSTFKAEFPIFQKIEVNGKNAAPLYKYLKSKKSGVFINEIKWNFAKFLVDKQGNVVQRYAPTTSPLQIESEIQSLLASA
ncbi:putative glutathione peroxidase 2 [Silene latifolia]|uniref:putative glutathione peroxidase 2 n=1 Tax=Silene latifolia TaxID=37657 RepID=UPI003D785F44